MDVRNCRVCGRLFNYLSGPNICQPCRDEAEKKFGNTKDFIRENPGATIGEIAEACEVSQQQIHQWIREERLQFSDDSPIGIACEKCGANIKTGRFCEKCKTTMASLLEDFIRKPKLEPEKPKKTGKPNDKMFFIN